MTEEKELEYKSNELLLNQKIEIMEKNQESSQALISALEEKIDAAMKQYSQLQYLNTELNEQLQNIQSDANENHLAEINQLKEDLEIASNRILMLEEQTRKKEKVLYEKDLRIDLLSEQLQCSKLKMKDIKSQFNQLRSECAEVKTKFDDVNSQLDTHVSSHLLLSNRTLEVHFSTFLIIINNKYNYYHS